MKNLFLTLVTMCTIGLYTSFNAQNVTLSWAEPNSGVYSTSNLQLCGSNKVVDLRATWTNDPSCPYSGFGPNRYEFTVKLYKDNVLITTRKSRSHSCWTNEIFKDFNLTEGNYRVHISLRVRKFPFWWQPQKSGYSAYLTVTRQAATPSFTINGVIPDPEVPVEVCPSKILIDPSGTSCETKYYVGIWEFDYNNWDRLGYYEWGKWFNGEAPIELNLQQLSAMHSFGSEYLGSDLNRQGEILYGGHLQNNEPRYYHVSICTGYPQWTCASAIIKVKCDCD